ncbi:prepilin peptidase [Actinokineospora sp. G85]|uniref:prepilin peptidase n=1 Tax=Actinokineospora sp. G85 TaxID=3406626 RepID=UPI003C712262
MDLWIHILTWSLLGAVVGAASNRSTCALAGSAHDAGLYSARLGALATAVLFGVVAWRTRSIENLVMLSCLATAAVPLAVIDMVEMRLPNPLVVAGYLTVGTCVVLAAVRRGDHAELERAAIGCVAMSALYLGLALFTGGLGGGDVKLGGLLGMISAWTGWSVLMASVTLGWLLLLLVFRFGSVERDGQAPAGPCLLVGTLAAILGAG